MNIKKMLRESLNKNILGVSVTKPDKVLIIMSGIPGSGKSTKAKELVGSGIIHSTDDVISSFGDYSKFFKDMKEKNDFSGLSKMHNINFLNAKKSMDFGITPIIIDNTNLSPSEPKKYIEYALSIGYRDDNIKFINIGTNNLTPEVLANRNTHGVPLDKIKQIIDKMKSHGVLTLDKVIDSKGMSKVIYTGIILDDSSKNLILNKFKNDIPKDWKIITHHVTITLGELRDKTILDNTVIMKVIKIGLSEKAIAVEVDVKDDIISNLIKNKIPHVTIAVNPEIGKPKDSNNIKKWLDVEHFTIIGKIKEIL